MIKGQLDSIWAGTEASLHAFVEATEQSRARVAAGWSPDEDPAEPEVPRLLDVQNGVGVVSIKGPLVNGDDNWMASFFGITPYGAVRDALVYAAGQADIDHILLDIDSGGGAVAGVADLGKLISTINGTVKPVTAFTDGMMASAAYWLGSSAGAVYGSDTATVGSIGVIATHREYSKMLADEGIKVTVMRAGKFKALVNGVEPLSETAKAQLQEQLDDAYKVFVGHVAERRNVPYEYADTHMAQGREFFGVKAEQAGLTDGTMSFDTLFVKIQQEIIDTDNRSHQNSGKINHMGISTMKKALTNTQLAALAEGGALAGVEAAAAMPAAEGQEGVGEVAGVPEASEAEVSGAPEAEAVLPAAEAKDDKSAELVSYLNGQIQEKDKALLEAGVKLAKAEDKLVEMNTSFEGLMAIAAKSVNNMQIALGGSASDFAGTKPEALVAEHARLSEQFHSKFKAGGVAAVDAPAVSEKSEPVVDAMTLARLAATRFSK